jgi:putative membrane protein insertion efficiency factor
MVLSMSVFLIPLFGEEPADTSGTRYPLCSLDSCYESQKRTESAFYDQTSPLSMLLVGLINIYQRIFSAREGSATCQFRPSCSHFGSLAIKKYGALQGTLMTGDRLLRCNQWTQGKYPLWTDNYHHIDPVEDHDLWAHDTL